MRKTALFILTFTFSAGAYAAELNGICAKDIKTDLISAVPAPTMVRTFPAPAAAPKSVCEAALARSIQFRTTVFRDAKDQPLRGFEKAYYTESGPMQVSLVLQTAKEAFYYYEDCDICAEIDKCDLKTGAVSRVVAAHSAGCSDIAKFAKGAVYNSCANAAPACSKIGEDVRIPEECCSKKAEPNQNGEMTCVAATPACSAAGAEVVMPEECCSKRAEYDERENLICQPAAPVVYPSCSAVGEDVRIPSECCSKNAEPNQNGEMTCVEAVPANSNCSKIGEDVRIPEECCSKTAEPNQNGEMTCVKAARARSPFAR